MAERRRSERDHLDLNPVKDFGLDIGGWNQIDLASENCFEVVLRACKTDQPHADG